MTRTLSGDDMYERRGSPFVPRVLFAGKIEPNGYALVLDGAAEKTLYRHVCGRLQQNPDQPIGVEELLDIAAQLLPALADLHRRGSLRFRSWRVVVQ
jgi:hypothetical protein